MSVLIFAVTCIVMIICVLIKPKFRFGKIYLSSYWVIATIGAVASIFVNIGSFNKILNALLSDSAVNPIKILTLFISMTFISVFLDSTGFFAYLAGRVMGIAGKRQFSLFLYLYITVSILTVFTSNDIIILTFTPFICYFCKSAKISPIPYLFAEFAAANTWSMFLIIGNPTNIYLASYFNTDFLTYIKEMALPTIFAGTVSFIILCILFKKQLSKPMESGERPEVSIRSRSLLAIGVIHLALCTVMLTVSSYIGLEMWLASLMFAVSLIICTFIHSFFKKQSPITILVALERVPWQLIPFVISMFILVLEFEASGVAKAIGDFLNNAKNPEIVYSFASAISANFLNNIPMSVLFGSVINASNAGKEALFGAIAGSNIGALISPVGALAGIMWTDILSVHKVKVSPLQFIKYGSAIAFPSLLAAAIGLFI